MRPELALITPTSDRHDALVFAVEWSRHALARLKGRATWIIVDDGVNSSRFVPALATAFLLGATDLIHEERPHDDAPAESFRGNLLAGLAIAEDLGAGHILIIEDDDWYARDYHEIMLKRLTEENLDLVGEAPARYFHLESHGAHQFPPSNHASLSSTGFRSSLIPKVRELLLRSPVGLDCQLWKNVEERKRLFPIEHVVGIKGFRGTANLGGGGRGSMYSEHGWERLEGWIGKEFTQMYRDYVRDLAE